MLQNTLMKMTTAVVLLAVSTAGLASTAQGGADWTGATMRGFFTGLVVAVVVMLLLARMRKRK